MSSFFVSKIKSIKRYLREASDEYLISTSDLFDKAWYKEKNPDLSPNVNLAYHYLRYGGFEGRDPSPNFNNSWYLDMYGDVRDAGLNPLLHYIKFGKNEGRKVLPMKDDSLNAKKGKSSIKSMPDRMIRFKPKKSKIFCIGRNKTGTTSIAHVLEDFGYKVGVQSKAELLMDDWARRDFRKIVEYCNTADAFQDVPFSLDYTYQILDYAFPGSKFILTIRNDADEWYQSLVRFHSKLLEIDRIPTADDLNQFTYRSKGWMWRNQQYIYGATESTIYDKKLYIDHYTNHNNRVVEYFRYRNQDLLVLNLSEPSAIQSLCEFLNVKYVGQSMPHLNKSKD